MGKLNLYSTGKVWENTNIPIGFLHISLEAQIHTIPKIWEKWIPIAKEKYGKTETLQS